MRPYALPIAAGILFALALYPFYLYPLALIGLTLLFWWVGGDRPYQETFKGAFFSGLAVGIPTSYYTLAQLLPLYDPVLVTLVRLCSIPGALSLALLWAAACTAAALLRSRLSFANALVAALCYTIFELAANTGLGGYYPSSLLYANLFSLTLLWVALGGAYGGIFCLSLASALVAEAARTRDWRHWAPLGVLAVLLFLPLVQEPWAASGELRSVAIIQNTPQPGEGFGVFADSSFTDFAVEPLLREAAAGSDLVLYPYSVIEEPYDETTAGAVGRWLASVVGDTPVALWATRRDGSVLYDEVDVWQSGKVARLQKRFLFSFSDYTPGWAKGLVPDPRFSLSEGSGSVAQVRGITVGALVCSEVHDRTASIKKSRGTHAVLSFGFDGFFPGRLMGETSLAVARVRAAENHVFVLRANPYGPSAIINPDGSVSARLEFGEQGILRGAISL